MQAKIYIAIVAVVTALVNLAFLLSGATHSLTCTIVQSIERTQAAVLNSM